jgi:hypothetical protein
MGPSNLFSHRFQKCLWPVLLRDLCLVCVCRRMSCSSWCLLKLSSSYHLSTRDAIYSRYGDPVLEFQYSLLVDWFMKSGWSCRQYLVYRRRVLLLHLSVLQMAAHNVSGFDRHDVRHGVILKCVQLT